MVWSSTFVRTAWLRLKVNLNQWNPSKTDEIQASLDEIAMRWNPTFVGIYTFQGRCFNRSAVLFCITKPRAPKNPTFTFRALLPSLLRNATFLPEEGFLEIRLRGGFICLKSKFARNAFLQICLNSWNEKISENKKTRKFPKLRKSLDKSGFRIYNI